MGTLNCEKNKLHLYSSLWNPQDPMIRKDVISPPRRSAKLMYRLQTGCMLSNAFSLVANVKVLAQNGLLTMSSQKAFGCQGFQRL